MESLNKNMTEMIQQSAMSIATQPKKQKKEEIRKHNLDETRSTIKKGQKNTQPRETPDDNTTGQTRQIDPRKI